MYEAVIWDAIMAMRLYVKPDTKACEVAAEYLRLYGLNPELQNDKHGAYFDVTPPTHWTPWRRAAYQAMLAQLKSE